LTIRTNEFKLHVVCAAMAPILFSHIVDSTAAANRFTTQYAVDAWIVVPIGLLYSTLWPGGKLRFPI